MKTGLLINIVILAITGSAVIFYIINKLYKKINPGPTCEKCNCENLHFVEMYTTYPTINSPVYSIYTCPKCGNKIYKRVVE